jgi:hypothetical protein
MVNSSDCTSSMLYAALDVLRRRPVFEVGDNGERSFVYIHNNQPLKSP